jgi:DNA-binding winged helix-turn-helix (wHTH) protein/TolB-like protein/Tfp pilus assembly protein PilF
MSVDLHAAAAPSEVRFRVGGWTVEPALNQLSAEGRNVKVEPKAMAVLLYLAERPGQVVTRETLLSTVWRDVVVGDDALTQVVVKLRRALGDQTEEPCYIQTVQKRGYRLVAQVASSADDSSGKDPRKRHALRSLGAAGAVLLVAVTLVWRFDSEVASIDAGAERAARPTVGITRFEAVGNDPQEVLLARGITADLATDLSKMSGVWVIRVAPATAQGPEASPAQAPSIGYLVSGSVQRVENRMRLNVHLTDTANGRQLWSEKFERALLDMFELQDELTLKILQVLPTKLGEAERRRVARRHTRNLEAYEAFQRGQQALHVRRRAENETARDLFRRAIELDPGFARAYVGLAMSYTADYRNQWAADRAAALARAFQLAQTAQQINPDIAETHWVLAFVHSHRLEHDRALEHLQAALRINPSFADGYALMGGIYTSIGRPAEGVVMLRTAMRLLPEAGYLYFMLLGRAYLVLGDLEQAKLNLRHAISRNPEFLDARVYMAAAHVAAGERPAAQWEVEEIRALQPDFSVRRWLETNPTAEGAVRIKLIRTLGELGL